MTTLGLIGYGAIARDIVSAFPPDAVDWLMLLREGASPELPANVSVVARIEQLIEAKPLAVVEAASQGAVATYIPALLEAGIPTVVASVGALADATLHARIAAAGRSGGARLILPAGALGGLDYLRAIAALPDARVRYTSRKPPTAWEAELASLGLSAERDAVTLFEGTPAEAASAYPKNLNAAFAVALAVGAEKVTVRVIADPKATGNSHEIEAESAAGTALFSMVNAPSPGNPKTSALTALSLVAALRDLLDMDLLDMGGRR
ncbi:aspartate dehydrogenase [Mesorhizobium sp. VK25A]|uniref:L-aspartate dehydrogenase n=1 Tax=Mesorhizobium vachelliae TaxID=3072309 RepID=A0ABU5A6F1_9HYPH|nr:MULTISPECIES: aspartate dehydrogenase [unclassified Mesorhizobium]MDX8533283.1 aspartate dehydrogenase [Mesorhizobium sp. VK25D]MDX8545202.1 aspartate dehydrogenase [Mesorhizobium sp. VK25A]